MSEYLIQDTTLNNIADAINAKTGGSSVMTPAEMVTAIAGIPSGGGDPWELIADYTSDAAATIVVAEIPLDYQNEPLYKVEILAEFNRIEYPYAYINSTSSNYGGGQRKANVPYLYTGYISNGQRFDNNVRNVSAVIFILSEMTKTASYPILSVGLKSYYEDSIKAGCNVKVWRLVE